MAVTLRCENGHKYYFGRRIWSDGRVEWVRFTSEEERGAWLWTGHNATTGRCADGSKKEKVFARDLPPDLTDADVRDWMGSDGQVSVETL